MASITSSISSLFQGVGNIVSGLIESILAVLTHIYNLIVSAVGVVLHAIQQLVLAVVHTFTGILSTLSHVAGDLIGIVTANIIPIALVGVGVVVALSLSGKKGSVSTSKKRS